MVIEQQAPKEAYLRSLLLDVIGLLLKTCRRQREIPNGLVCRLQQPMLIGGAVVGPLRNVGAISGAAIPDL